MSNSYFKRLWTYQHLPNHLSSEHKSKSSHELFDWKKLKRLYKLQTMIFPQKLTKICSCGYWEKSNLINGRMIMATKPQTNTLSPLYLIPAWTSHCLLLCCYLHTETMTKNKMIIKVYFCLFSQNYMYVNIEWKIFSVWVFPRQLFSNLLQIILIFYL